MLTISKVGVMNRSFGESRIVVCGAARNVENEIEKVVSNILTSFSSFLEIQIIICESFSTDKTVEKLTEIQNRVPNLVFFQDERVSFGETRRTVRIASSRNELQSKVREHYSDFDYVAMMDLDGVNRDLTKNAVNSILEFDQWDGAFANQPFRYYDIWALRARDWNEQDCWREFERLSLTMPIKTARRIAVLSKMRSIAENSAPILVDSAFGGLGIYRMKAFLDARYMGEDDAEQEVCEHVYFHETLIKKGYRLYIIPSLVNLSPFTQRMNIAKELILKIVGKVK